jgi:glycerol-3-phosphate dehydrogenase
LIADDPSLADPLIETLPYVVADVVYAVRCEMAIHLADVLARRTRAQLQNARATRDAAEKVATIMGKELGWTKKRREAEIENFVEMVNAELKEAGLKKQQAKVA